MNNSEQITHDAIRLIKSESERTGIPAIHIQGYKVEGLPKITREKLAESRAIRNQIIIELSEMGHRADMLGSIFARSHETIQAILRRREKAPI